MRISDCISINNKIEVLKISQSIRRELINAYVFRYLSVVKQLVSEYTIDNNYHRPHDSLGNKTPSQMMDETNAKVSNFEWPEK